MFRACFAATLLAATVLANPALASLIGLQLSAAYYLPIASSLYPQASFSPQTFTVGPGIETVGNVENVTSIPIDVSDLSLSVLFQTILSSPTWNAAEFNGVILTSTSPLGLAGASVASTTMAGFDNSRVQVTDNQILLNWQGLSYVNGTSINVVFSATTVPEPASLALLSLGLAGLAVVRRRSRC